MFDFVDYLAIIATNFFRSGLGWRYVFSRRYRNHTHERWKTERPSEIIGEVALYGIGLLLTILIIITVAK